MNELIEKLREIKKPAIIAVSGFGGSGKSTIAKKIATEINSPVIGVDFFQTNEVFNTNFSDWNVMNFKRLEDEVLIPFLKNEPEINYGHFDSKIDSIYEIIKIKNNGILIIEGVGLFRPELLNYFNYKIWVDVPIEEAIRRGKHRDRHEYNNPTDELWDTVWKDNDLECFEKYRPLEIADYFFKNY